MSHNVVSGSDFESHTTTLNRFVALSSALMLTRDYLRANNSVVLGYPKGERLKMFCAVSSPCHAAALDPHLIHRNIVGRDVGVKIYEISKRLSDSYPLDVHYYCTPSSKNIGSVTEDPVAHTSPLAVTKFGRMDELTS
mgnify:CR=1 FL=1